VPGSVPVPDLSGAYGGSAQAPDIVQQGDITIKGASQWGPQHKVISDTVGGLKNALAGGGNCAAWLTQGFTANAEYTTYYGSLTEFLEDLPRYIAYADISGGGKINAINSNIVVGYNILINTNGAFFGAGEGAVATGDRYNDFLKNIRGGTVAGREFILLHEIGHLLNVPGFRSDDLRNEGNHKANNDAVWQNCGDLLMRQR